MGMIDTSALLELPWRGQTSEETLLDNMRGEKLLATCGFLGRINSYVGSTFAPMFQDVANACLTQSQRYG